MFEVQHNLTSLTILLPVLEIFQKGYIQHGGHNSEKKKSFVKDYCDFLVLLIYINLQQFNLLDYFYIVYLLTTWSLKRCTYLHNSKLQFTEEE